MPNFTKKAIKESFIKLLNQRPLNQITVKDIVEDCGINRNSFYYHFQDIPALLDEIITEQLTEIVRQYPSIDSVEQCLSAVLSFAFQNRRAVLHIFNSLSRDIYEQYLMQSCEESAERYVDRLIGERPVSEGDRLLIIRMLKCEMYGFITDWLSEGMKSSIIDDFARLSSLRRGMLEDMIQRSIEQKDGE